MYVTHNRYTYVDLIWSMYGQVGQFERRSHFETNVQIDQLNNKSFIR